MRAATVSLALVLSILLHPTMTAHSQPKKKEINGDLRFSGICGTNKKLFVCLEINVAGKVQAFPLLKVGDHYRDIAVLECNAPYDAVTLKTAKGVGRLRIGQAVSISTQDTDATINELFSRYGDMVPPARFQPIK